MMDCLRPFTMATVYSVLLAVLLLLVVPADRFSAAQGDRSANSDRGRNSPKPVTDQDLLNKFRDLANDHLSLSFLYLGYAAYFDRADVALPGFRDYFSKLATREQDMGRKLFDYVNKRGGHVVLERMHFNKWCNQLKDLHMTYFNEHRKSCICRHVVNKNKCKLTSDQGLEGLRDVYLAENHMYSIMAELHGNATGLDPAARHLVEDEFLVQRVDAIKAVNSTITELLRFKKDKKPSVGEYLIDNEIGK